MWGSKIAENCDRDNSFVRQPSSVASDHPHLLEFTPYALLSPWVLTSHSLLEITYGKSDRLSLLLLGYKRIWLLPYSNSLSGFFHTFALMKEAAMFWVSLWIDKNMRVAIVQCPWRSWISPVATWVSLGLDPSSGMPSEERVCSPFQYLVGSLARSWCQGPSWTTSGSTETIRRRKGVVLSYWVWG